MRGWKLLVAVTLPSLVLTGCINASEPLQVTHTLQNGTAGPGLWRSLGGDNCSWAQNGTYKGNWRGGDNIDQHAMHGGPVYAQILDTPGSFTSYDCVTFWLSGGPFDRPLATPGQPFGPGDFRIGPEIAPGTYTAPGGRCSWQRLTDFTFSGRDIIESGGTDGVQTQTVTIDAHDVGFSSDGCGTWTKVPG
jgi:hypothetical protein